MAGQWRWDSDEDETSSGTVVLLVRQARRKNDGKWAMAGEVWGGPHDGASLRWTQTNAPESVASALRRGHRVRVEVHADDVLDLVGGRPGSVKIVERARPLTWWARLRTWLGL